MPASPPDTFTGDHPKELIYGVRREPPAHTPAVTPGNNEQHRLVSGALEGFRHG